MNRRGSRAVNVGATTSRTSNNSSIAGGSTSAGLSTLTRTSHPTRGATTQPSRRGTGSQGTEHNNDSFTTYGNGSEGSGTDHYSGSFTTYGSSDADSNKTDEDTKENPFIPEDEEVVAEVKAKDEKPKDSLAKKLARYNITDEKAIERAHQIQEKYKNKGRSDEEAEANAVASARLYFSDHGRQLLSTEEESTLAKNRIKDSFIEKGVTEDDAENKLSDLIEDMYFMDS